LSLQPRPEIRALKISEHGGFSPAMVEDNNLLVLRSMTKDYTLAGLRLGYAIAGDEIIDSLRRVCPPWNVNTVAQQAAIFALQQDEFLKRSRVMVAGGKDYLVRQLTRLGLRCHQRS